MNTYGITLKSAYRGEAVEDRWPHYLWQVTLHRADKVLTIENFRRGMADIQSACGAPVVRGDGWILPMLWRASCDHPACHAPGGIVPQPPDLYDVLCSIKADTTFGETFEDWALSLGLDSDSRKALAIYLECQASEARARAFFGDDWETLMEDEDYL